MSTTWAEISGVPTEFRSNRRANAIDSPSAPVKNAAAANTPIAANANAKYSHHGRPFDRLVGRLESVITSLAIRIPI
jgi:hypothetical protein